MTSPAINPISFPEDHSGSNHPSTPFPYTSIDATPTTPSNNNRMQQLESMLKEVQGRAEIVEKEAYEKAYLAGEKAGMILGRKRGEQMLESIQTTLQDAEETLLSMQQSFAEASLDVAKHAAETIVGDIVNTDMQKLLDIAQHAAAQLPDHSELRIAVSQDDFSSFKRLFEDGQTMMSLSCDATVQNGTCRIMSSQQDILIDPVAAVTTYLNTLRPALLKPLSDHAKPN